MRRTDIQETQALSAPSLEKLGTSSQLLENIKVIITDSHLPDKGYNY